MDHDLVVQTQPSNSVVYLRNTRVLLYKVDHCGFQKSMAMRDLRYFFFSFHKISYFQERTARQNINIKMNCFMRKNI